MKKSSKLMEVLKAHGLANDPRLLGEIVAAEFIDAMEHPEAMMELAQFVNSEGARRLIRRLRRGNRRPKKATVDI